MNACTMCGSVVPDGQEVCSMCYGDPSYGSDGYYQNYLDGQEKKARRKEQEIERAEDDYWSERDEDAS